MGCTGQGSALGLRVDGSDADLEPCGDLAGGQELGDPELAESLCAAIIRVSALKGRRGVVALPPFTPTTPLRRVGFAAP